MSNSHVPLVVEHVFGDGAVPVPPFKLYVMVISVFFGHASPPSQTYPAGHDTHEFPVAKSSSTNIAPFQLLEPQSDKYVFSAHDTYVLYVGHVYAADIAFLTNAHTNNTVKKPRNLRIFPITSPLLYIMIEKITNIAQEKK